MALQIVGIDISNFKRVEAFSCRIDKQAGVITIGGENANGKSSVLDAVYSALVGPQAAVKNPVHDGADAAHIRVTLGSGQDVEYKVVRSFPKQGPPSIKVFDAKGNPSTNGSALLKELIGAGGIDPVQFLNLEPIKQRNQLAQLVGLNLETYDQQIASARDRMKEAEAHQLRLEARVTALPWYDDAPESLTDAQELASKLTEATMHNSKRALMQNGLQALESRIGTLAVDIERLEAELASKRASLEAVKTEHVNLSLELAGFQAVDTDALSEAMKTVEETNNKVRANQAKIAAKKEWDQAEDDVKRAKEIEGAAIKAKKDALAAAKFPVDGLAFDSQTITYKGQPLSQASQAERLYVAISIALAQRGRVAPIILRDASTLDRDSLAMVEELAVKHGALVFAEIVANKDGDQFDRECDFYVEDGNKWEAN